MYVCVCNAITDREIRGAAELGARTLEDLSATLGVATCCRKCSDCASKVLAEPTVDDAPDANADDDADDAALLDATVDAAAVLDDGDTPPLFDVELFLARPADHLRLQSRIGAHRAGFGHSPCVNEIDA